MKIQRIFILIALIVCISCQSKATDGIIAPPQLNLDQDNDEVLDFYDNCPDVRNPDQEDLNENGIGGACESFTYVYEDFGQPKKMIRSLHGNGYIIAGEYHAVGSRIVYVAAFDQSGNLVWRKDFDNFPNLNSVKDFIVDNASDSPGYILAGMYLDQGESIGWIRKMDEEGNTLWHKENFTEDIYTFSVGFTADNHYLIGSISYSPYHFSTGYATKIHAVSGRILWSKKFVEKSMKTFHIFTLQTKDGNIILYNGHGFAGEQDLFHAGAAIFDQEGNLLSNSLHRFDEHFMISSAKMIGDTCVYVGFHKDAGIIGFFDAQEYFYRFFRYPSFLDWDLYATDFRGILQGPRDIFYISAQQHVPMILTFQLEQFFNVEINAPSPRGINVLVPNSGEYYTPIIMSFVKSYEEGFISALGRVNGDEHNVSWLIQTTSKGVAETSPTTK